MYSNLVIPTIGASCIFLLKSVLKKFEKNKELIFGGCFGAASLLGGISFIFANSYNAICGWLVKTCLFSSGLVICGFITFILYNSPPELLSHETPPEEEKTQAVQVQISSNETPVAENEPQSNENNTNENNNPEDRYQGISNSTQDILTKAYIDKIKKILENQDTWKFFSMGFLLYMPTVLSLRKGRLGDLSQSYLTLFSATLAFPVAGIIVERANHKYLFLGCICVKGILSVIIESLKYGSSRLYYMMLFLDSIAIVFPIALFYLKVIRFYGLDNCVEAIGITAFANFLGSGLSIFVIIWLNYISNSESKANIFRYIISILLECASGYFIWFSMPNEKLNQSREQQVDSSHVDTKKGINIQGSNNQINQGYIPPTSQGPDQGLIQPDHPQPIEPGYGIDNNSNVVDNNQPSDDTQQQSNDSQKNDENQESLDNALSNPLVEDLIK